jgi:type II secretion system protein H
VRVGPRSVGPRSVGPRSVGPGLAGLRQDGFSLLELLVTLMVVVLVTSLVSLTLSSGGRDIELEAQARNIAEVAAYALDEAQLQGHDYGLLLQRVSEDGELGYRYSWRERLLDGWQAPASGKEIFADQYLPAGVEPLMELEEATIADIPLAADDQEPEPQVVFYASGETTAGSMELRDEDGGELLWRLEWDLLGRFEVLRRGETPEESM